MRQIVGALAALVFAVLSLVHFYWSLGGNRGKLVAVPEVSGRRAFVPSAGGTFVVGLGTSKTSMSR